jgi:hypothetical protein
MPHPRAVLDGSFDGYTDQGGEVVAVGPRKAKGRKQVKP